MEKKAYKTPSVRVRRLQPMLMVADSNRVESVGGNAGIKGGTSGSDTEARSGGHRGGIWDSMGE